MTDREPATEVQEMESTRQGSMELAAAKLAGSVGSLMSRAVRSGDKRARDVAERMLVTEGRISQILSAKGNVKVSTLAKLMDACGYEVSITATPKDPSIPSIAPHLRPSSRPVGLTKADTDVTWGMNVVHMVYANLSDFIETDVLVTIDDRVVALENAAHHTMWTPWHLKAGCREGHVEAETPKCLYQPDSRMQKA